MRTFTWLVGGGAAAVAVYYYWTRRDRGASDVLDGPDKKVAPATPSGMTPRSPNSGETPPRVEPLPGWWVWPAAVWRGRRPEVSDGFASKRRTPAGDVITHGGVDIMYRRQPGDAWPAGTPHGTPNFVMPDDRAALAASDGVVSFAAQTPRGWSVIIDHAPRKVTTYYTHLSSLLVSSKQKVSAGTPIGIIGADPLDAQHLLHLHFEVRRGGPGDQIDPQPLMASWEYLLDPQLPRAPVARNVRAPSAHDSWVPVAAHDRRWPRHGG